MGLEMMFAASVPRAEARGYKLSPYGLRGSKAKNPILSG